MSTILAIDGGGTRTRAGLYSAEGVLLGEAEGKGCNPSTAGEDASASVVAELADRLVSETGESIGRIVAGIAGAGFGGKAERLATEIARITKVADVAVASDLVMTFYANCSAEAPVMVLAGTGSSVIARPVSGEPVMVGRMGSVVDDDGSAYRISARAIKYAEDDAELLAALLAKWELDTYEDFAIPVHCLDTAEFSELAPVVSALAGTGNRAALDCIESEAVALASQVLRALRRAKLEDDATDSTLTVLTHGGVFENCDLYGDAFAVALRSVYPRLLTRMTPVRGHAAAFKVAICDELPGEFSVCDEASVQVLPQTERMEAGARLDEIDDEELSMEMWVADMEAHRGAGEAEVLVFHAMTVAAECLRAGGRIIYMGAGTSGRLGVLDASECPPTFGVSEDRVVGLIAGGDAALRHSIEGAEDDEGQGVRDLEGLVPPPGPDDIVIGITASGTTPYVLAALGRARELEARTALICCNPVALDVADIVIFLDTGPEILPGSTRLKAGTATKMVLNQISTGAMAKAGYVFEGRMVGVRPVNAKLRRRCIRIVGELTERTESDAEALLDSAYGSIRVAVIMARKDLDAEEAGARLEAAGGILRAALEAS